MDPDFVSWKWHPCSAEIINSNVLTGTPLRLISDAPIVFASQTIDVSLTISLSKPFNFSRDIGWNWHKSWNLPDLQCTIRTTGDKNFDILNHVNLSASLFVVKTHYQSMNLESIGCKGNSQQQVSNGRCIFKCLKFNTTSYNNEHQKFQLVIVLSYTNERKEQVICCSRISSNIFVDSRKHARCQSKQPSPQPFIEPFLPENLERHLFKRENRSKESTVLEIDDTYQGAINYYTAANIRHKIKHPLFLALRFSKSLKLFVDPDQIDPTKNIVEQIHQQLVIEQRVSKTCNKAINLLFEIEQLDSGVQRKALEIIQLLENDRYDIFTKRSYMPTALVEIQKSAALVQEYKQSYPYLLSQRSPGLQRKGSSKGSLNDIKVALEPPAEGTQRIEPQCGQVQQISQTYFHGVPDLQAECLKKVKVESNQQPNEMQHTGAQIKGFQQQKPYYPYPNYQSQAVNQFINPFNTFSPFPPLCPPFPQMYPFFDYFNFRS